MMQANESIDNLIKLIDDELIILSNAQSVGKYKWFDFKAALQLLNDKLQNEGYNEYRKRKVSKLINVFEDLCHTIVESTSVRNLFYDKTSGIIRREEITYNALNYNSTISEKEYEADPELKSYYEGLELPEPYSSKLSETIKINYILDGCVIDYSALQQVYDVNPGTEKILAGIGCWSYHLSGSDSFHSYFDVDINYVGRHRISFEGYIKQLKAERLINSTSTTTNSVEQMQEIIHFSVNKNRAEMQRILIALQQDGFISSDTTIDTFDYRMTGHGSSTLQRIVWTKRSKSKAISWASLIDFLVAMGVGVEDALLQIKNIFSREGNSDAIISDDAKTTARKKNRDGKSLSEYHDKIKTIIAEENAL